MKKENLIIIGGTGFIGFNVIQKFIKKKKFNILSLSSKIPSKSRKFKEVDYIVCDIFKKRKLEMLLKKKKLIMLLISLVTLIIKIKIKLIKVIILAARILLRYLKKKRLKDLYN